MNTKHRLIALIATLLVLSILKLAMAAIPTTLNYQGHLTDSGGTPIDGPVSMSFAIYDIETGGSALWSDTRSVTVDQGVFSVELGGGGNPFPVGLFENPLWMGLTVGSDAEMTPRRPLSSTAYSFKADDANTLEGVSAGTLDQSAHVIDTANPHSVTTAQIGAADAAALSAHTSDTTNPHSVTAAQAGAASSSDFTTHTGNSAAHHTRFTSGEAVTAMGTKTDTNPLHHDKYTDANVVTAMLANDGAGSTLDSDKVDGLEASELIDAAQDEVRTPISSLPYTISTPGSYYLTGNLDGSSGGINISADDVTLDLMGFTIDGGGSVNDHGIYFFGYSNVTIRNGSVKNFGLAGIYQGNFAPRYATVVDVQAMGNGTLGTSSTHSGILLYSSNSHVERCVVANNGGYGVYVYLSSKLLNNTAYNNTGSYGLYGHSGSTVSGNTVYGHAGTTAVYGGNGASITGNTVYSNSGTYGIYTSIGSTISGNTVYNNNHWGVYAGNANLITNNTITYNNTGNFSNQGGLRVAYDSRVTGNTLDNNNQFNIAVAGSDNTLEDNLLTDSIDGIYFSISGNFYGNNRASGNTTNYNLGSTSQSTSTYLPNISF